MPVGIFAVCLCILGCRERKPHQELRAENALVDEATQTRRSTELPAGPLDLDRAIRYALENNLQLWAARQERIIQQELTRGTRLRMLPSLLLNAEASQRSEYPANQSVDLFTGRESSDISYSADRQTRRLHLNAVWNLLDLGVSCLRTKQDLDREAMADMRLKRMRQTLILDVTRAYWRTAALRASKELATRINKAIAKTLGSVRVARDEEAISEAEALQREAPLLEQQFKLQQAIDQYHAARAELCGLLGLEPGEDLTLVREPFEEKPSDFAGSMQEMEKEAVRQRPELVEKDLEERVSHLEARVALAQMFPSPAAFLRYDNDKNPLLYFSNWTTVGLRASWDLLSLPSRIQQGRTGRARAELTARRRLALAVGILAQVHVSVMEYERVRKQLDLATVIASKRAKLVLALAAAAKEGKSHEGELIGPQVKLFAAQSLYWMTYANCQTARARIMHTLGRESARSVKAAPGDGKAPAPELVAKPEETFVDIYAPSEEDLVPVGSFDRTPEQEEEDLSGELGPHSEDLLDDPSEAEVSLPAPGAEETVVSDELELISIAPLADG